VNSKILFSSKFFFSKFFNTYRYRPQKIFSYLFLLAKIALLRHIILPWPHLSSCSVPFDSFLSTETHGTVQFCIIIQPLFFPPPLSPPILCYGCIPDTSFSASIANIFNADKTVLTVRFKTKIRELIIVHNNKTQDYNIFFILKNLTDFRQRLDRGRKKWVRRGRGQKGVCGHKRWGQNWRGEGGRTR